MQSHKQQSELWTLVGKAIAQRPKEVLRLLDKHNIAIRKREDSKELLEGILNGMARNNQIFNRDLSQLLTTVEKNDGFIGAIAGAVGAVAGAIGSGQQKKAMKEQARAQTFSSIMAYKAQQEATRMEELKLRQKEKEKVKPQGLQNKTMLIVIGVVVALIIVGLVYYQRSQPRIKMITQPINK